MEVGFLYLKNVGVPEELFDRVIEKGTTFFDIPLEDKSVPITIPVLLSTAFPHDTYRTSLIPSSWL